MVNLIVKILMANKYWVFGISFTISAISCYLMFNTPAEKVFLECTYMIFMVFSAPLMGWNLSRIVERD
jgi:hypothetical protein